MTIKQFFNELNKEINNVNNKRTFIFLERKAKNYKENFNNIYIKKAVKNQVNKEYKKSIKLIQKRKKQIKD